ncbi:MAG: endonuclease/exonuclease/phosphatase family protein [Wenzhouxiangellaceae bacterium]|nr:endonuclease/exonuclease/phosphatase family protein [Wenzhouxiangellaceae bacterium]
MTALPSRRLKLLSFNIQAGTSTATYRQYVTRSWRQVLPNHQRTANLEQIAELAGDYDIIGLQEADCGSLRSGFINQAKYIADHAGFEWWTHQPNRKVGVIAHAGNAVLSRIVPEQVDAHRLPGPIPGRGALILRFGSGEQALWLAVLHLALGRRARQQQLGYVAQLLRRQRNVVVMGDLNAGPESRELREFTRRSELILPHPHPVTFPSWQPRRAIDHILVSRSIRVINYGTVDSQVSDHLPLAIELELPASTRLDRHAQGNQQQEDPEHARQSR